LACQQPINLNTASGLQTIPIRLDMITWCQYLKNFFVTDDRVFVPRSA
jgi:hypothetical protein